MDSTTNLVLQRTERRVIVGQFLLCLIIVLPIDCVGQEKESKTASEIGAKQDEQKANPVKTDLLGDPLPPNALLRMGTNRFCPRSPSNVVLSADEQIVVTFAGKLIEAWEANSGRLLWSKTTKASRNSGAGLASYGIRPFCRMPKSGQLATTSQTGGLEFWDFKTGKSESLQTETKENFKSIEVSPDETMFALGGEKLLVVCDRHCAALDSFWNSLAHYSVSQCPDRSAAAGGSRVRPAINASLRLTRDSPETPRIRCLHLARTETSSVLL